LDLFYVTVNNNGLYSPSLVRKASTQEKLCSLDIVYMKENYLTKY